MSVQLIWDLKEKERSQEKINFSELIAIIINSVTFKILLEPDCLSSNLALPLTICMYLGK